METCRPPAQLELRTSDRHFDDPGHLGIGGGEGDDADRLARRLRVFVRESVWATHYVAIVRVSFYLPYQLSAGSACRSKTPFCSHHLSL